MEKQNARNKARGELQAQERKRISKLVDLAYCLDPRIAARKQVEKKRREEIKEAKKRALEARRAAEDEHRRLEAEAAEAARAKQEEAARVERQRIAKLREIVKRHCKDAGVESAWADTVAVDALQTLCDKLGAIAGSDVPKEKRDAMIEAALQVHVQAPPLNGSRPAGAEWTPQELSTLAKAFQKYPGGAAGRWEKIAAFIGTGRTPKEVIEKSRTLGESEASLKQRLNREAFKTFSTENKGVFKSIDSMPDEADAEGRRAFAGTDVWTADQQRSLEMALKNFPAAMGTKERWHAIA
eukprot:Polyplicarium_translucidae@DN2338_c0_g1_i1.p1